MLSATALYTSRVKLGRSCRTFSTLQHHSPGGRFSNFDLQLHCIEYNALRSGRPRGPFAHRARGANLGQVGFDTRSFFPWSGRSPVSYVRYSFPSKESQHILERDNLDPHVVPGGQIGLGSRKLNVPRGAPSLRSG